MSEDKLEGLPPLWHIVLSAGSIRKSIVFDDETLGEKNPIVTPEYRELIQKSGLKKVVESRSTWFFAHVRGLYEFIGDLEDTEKAKNRCDCIWTFLECTEGAALCNAIRFADSDGRLQELRKDMESTGFARALLNYSDAVPKALDENAFLLLADNIDDDLWNVINHTFSPLTREEHDLVHKRRNNAKRNASRKTEKTLSTGDILKRFWLSHSLWRMNAGQILSTLKMLESGGKAEDYERDCKKVEKAIRTLGLHRYELEPDV